MSLSLSGAQADAAGGWQMSLSLSGAQSDAAGGWQKSLSLSGAQASGLPARRDLAGMTAVAAAMAGPDKIAASGMSRTFPAVSQRAITHGHTSPDGSTAAIPRPQFPHSSDTSGPALAARPRWRSRSVLIRVTPMASSSARACLVRCPSVSLMMPARSGMPRLTACPMLARVRAWLPGRPVIASCSRGSSL